MARTTITKTTAPGYWSTTGAAVTMTAADVTNGNQVEAAGEVLLIVRNSGGSAYTVSINSAPDPITGRTGHVSAQSLAAGEIRIFRLIPTGWSISGWYEINASNAAVLIGAVQL